MEEMLLEMRNIHKRFPGVYALKGVNLSLRAGEVLAIVGENGAGKSTLMNVLGGIYARNDGTILIDGKEVTIRNVLDSQRAGISIIHQELVLVPELSVAENIFINREPISKTGFVDFQILYQKAQQFINDLGLSIKAESIVSHLTIAQQQMVEIVKAVSFHARIIVMDEPTSSLSDKEVDALFANIRNLKAKGIGIIYISHKLSELPQIADSVLVMRDGQSIKHMRMSETNNDEIVALMVGREMTNYYSRTFNPSSEVALKVTGLTTNRVKDVSFSLHKGEILGFSGLVGAGRTETVLGLLGLDKMRAGSIELNGKPYVFRKPEVAYRSGIGFIPESRREESLFPVMPVRFNLTIKALKQFIHGIKVDKRKEAKLTQDSIKELRIKTPSQETSIQTLSGGNQQKVIISSWLITNPKILIMDEPTRGIDVGAKAEIYALMNELAKQGMAIIMISSDLPEVINMSDRVVVMRDGSVSKILEHNQISQEEIMRYSVDVTF
jgi:ABC-type sugar transport system ATPase subunit